MASRLRLARGRPGSARKIHRPRWGEIRGNILKQDDLNAEFDAIDADISTKLDLDASNGPLTGTLGTQALLPSSHNSYDIGAESTRYLRMFTSKIVAVNTTGNPTLLYSSGHLIGQAIGNNATLEAFGAGANCFASARADGTLGTARIRSLGVGANCFGQARNENPTGSGTDALISTAGAGSNAFGYTHVGATATGSASIQANGDGAFAVGMVDNIVLGGTGQLVSSNNGAFAEGYILEVGNNGKIQATGLGSRAFGYVDTNGGTIEATGSGTTAMGYASGGTLTASANGAAVWGYSTIALGSIVASAQNAFQFGPGTNSTADSLQVQDGVLLLASGQVQCLKDSNGLYLGAGQDAHVYYDGTNLILDPNVVGAGKVLIGATANDTLQATRIDLIADSTGVYFGGGQDAHLYYDGTNLILDPQVVGTGDVYIGAQKAATDYRLVFNGVTNQGGMTWRNTQGRLRFDDDIELADAKNVTLNTTTGTKIGTGSSQKLGFWNRAPKVQPSGTGETVGFTAGAGAGVNDDSTFTGNIGSTAYRINDIVKALKDIGLLAT